MATRILAGETLAYKQVFQYRNPLERIRQYFAKCDVTFENSSSATVNLFVHSEELIPSETKSILKSGALSVKKMAKGQFFELYQDYVVSVSLRIARELFALLPIHTVTVNTMAKMLDSSTGHMKEQTILSVLFPRETLEKMKFDMIDPSDSLGKFKHEMKFKKTKGFIGSEFSI